MKSSIGLAKVKYSSSVGHIPQHWNGDPADLTLVLTERLTRKKASGAWPSAALQLVLRDFNLDAQNCQIAENRDVDHPRDYEQFLNTQMPFDEYLIQNKLTAFSSKFNQHIQFYPHHYAHALVAELMSPFRKALIVVLDGAGSRLKDIPREHLLGVQPLDGSVEECTFYLLDKDQPEALKLVRKDWQRFQKGTLSKQFEWSSGVGMLYERAAEFIFDSNQAAGKVMGLASFGQAGPIDDAEKFCDELDWSKRYQGQSNEEWGRWCEELKASDLAATVQAFFEQDVMNRLSQIRQQFPEYEDVILVGGCALNCTLNWKIIKSGLARQLYIPPFPGDAGLGLGLAFGRHKKLHPQQSIHLSYEQQITAFGPRNRTNTQTSIIEIFGDYSVRDCKQDLSCVVDKLKAGEVIAWFCGRSESGPRALGHRSLLALPHQPGLKNYLNQHIKFRESFRPYGCSVLSSSAHQYFNIPKGFQNPFMSFAVPVLSQWCDYLKEVSHVDGTSRMQTVQKNQNPVFHDLLCEIQKHQLPPIVLNTSLNIMGEPIVESYDDLKRFLSQSKITFAYVDGFLIEKSL